MGSPLSPVVANIFMESFESTTIIIWPHGRDTLDNFLGHLSTQHPEITFTIEVEKNGVIPFLDILVTRKPSGRLGKTDIIYPRSGNRFRNPRPPLSKQPFKPPAERILYKPGTQRYTYKDPRDHTGQGHPNWRKRNGHSLHIGLDHVRGKEKLQPRRQEHDFRWAKGKNPSGTGKTSYYKERSGSQRHRYQQLQGFGRRNKAVSESRHGSQVPQKTSGWQWYTMPHLLPGGRMATVNSPEENP
ncbi:hypothetical protein Trydic_g8073 [Trypoxylus dichotomus]